MWLSSKRNSACQCFAFAHKHINDFICEIGIYIFADEMAASAFNRSSAMEFGDSSLLFSGLKSIALPQQSWQVMSRQFVAFWPFQTSCPPKNFQSRIHKVHSTDSICLYSIPHDLSSGHWAPFWASLTQSLGNVRRQSEAQSQIAQNRILKWITHSFHSLHRDNVAQVSKVLENLVNIHLLSNFLFLGLFKCS